MVTEDRERSSEAATLTETYEYEWGAAVSAVDGQTVTIEAADAAAGWHRASWAVAKSLEWDFASVEYAGQVWEPGDETWSEVDGETVEAAVTDESTVVITLNGGA